MKVEVEFPGDFDSDKPCPIHLGRFQIGGHVARLYLLPNGQTQLAIAKSAIEDGSINLLEPIPEGALLGFPAEPKAAPIHETVVPASRCSVRRLESDVRCTLPWLHKGRCKFE